METWLWAGDVMISPDFEDCGLLRCGIDGECSFILTPDETRQLVAHLQAALVRYNAARGAR